MEKYLFIALGAAAGANARYLAGVWAGDHFGAAFPAGTLLVNVTGSLILAFAALAGGRLAFLPNCVCCWLWAFWAPTQRFHPLL